MNTSNELLIDIALRAKDLPELQKFCAQFVIEKGFADESPQDLMILLQEELGELARSVRKTIGIKHERQGQIAESSDHLALELADCFKYILILANKFNVDLLTAFQKKQRIDCNRTWSSK